MPRRLTLHLWSWNLLYHHYSCPEHSFQPTQSYENLTYAKIILRGWKARQHGRILIPLVLVDDDRLQGRSSTRAQQPIAEGLERVTKAIFLLTGQPFAGRNDSSNCLQGLDDSKDDGLY